MRLRSLSFLMLLHLVQLIGGTPKSGVQVSVTDPRESGVKVSTPTPDGKVSGEVSTAAPDQKASGDNVNTPAADTKVSTPTPDGKASGEVSTAAPDQKASGDNVNTPAADTKASTPAPDAKVSSPAPDIKDLDPKRKEVQDKIVQLHNNYRAQVKPTASNMLEMVWFDEAAKQAQQWAESCQKLVHNPIEERKVKDLGGCGQNIYVAQQQDGWDKAVKMWYDEVKDFTYGSPNNNLMAVGHYTQVVWYSSYKVGCGVHKCPDFYNYVCNYCPAGNLQLARPYKEGKPCGSCPNSCKNGTLCTNSCEYVDEPNNCNELMKSGQCSDKKSEFYPKCRATCLCTGKIYQQSEQQQQ